jgi:hypothetical protein
MINQEGLSIFKKESDSPSSFRSSTTIAIVEIKNSRNERLNQVQPLKDTSLTSKYIHLRNEK